MVHFNGSLQSGLTLTPPPMRAGFYVTPKLDCPHVAEHVRCNASKEALKAVAALGPCETCHDPKENWACLQCAFTDE